MGKLSTGSFFIWQSFESITPPVFGQWIRVMVSYYIGYRKAIGSKDRKIEHWVIFYLAKFRENYTSQFRAMNKDASMILMLKLGSNAVQLNYAFF